MKVAKKYKDSGLSNRIEVYANDVMMQMECKYYAQLYNQSADIPKHIDVLNSYLIVMVSIYSEISKWVRAQVDRPAHDVYSVENYVHGNTIHFRMRDTHLW